MGNRKIKWKSRQSVKDSKNNWELQSRIFEFAKQDLCQNLFLYFRSFSRKSISLKTFSVKDSD